MLLPTRTHFASPNDYDTISSFYDCDHPKVGDVRIITPAIVDAVTGGFALKERGRLQVVDKLLKKTTEEPDEGHKDAPVEANESSGRRREGSPSLDVLRGFATEEKSRAKDVATDPIRSSAKSFYQRLVAGGSVTNDLIYLTSEKSASKQGITNRDEFLREVKHALGDFVLFVSSESQGWLFPNPGLVFRPDSLSKLFPSLTAERFDSKQYVEPVSVVRVGKGRWKVSTSENGTPPAQGSTATSKKGTKPEIVRPTISTPAFTKSKLKPLLVGMVIFTLCVAYLAIVVLHVWTGSPGNQIAKNESMILVEGGTFMMGRNAGDEYERPEHNVTVKSFYIDTYEVTRDEYEKFIAATNHRQPSDWANGHYSPGTARWPVTGVDWYDADAYSKWAGKRLPTEEEWEFAARGTKGFRYPWGNDWIPGSANANSASQGLADVDKFKGASPFGVVGMVGNAWEWTASKLTAYPGARIPLQDHDLRVIRGGSWQSDQTSATTTYRWGWPASGGSDYKNTGFRCVKDASPQPSK
jgi:formylglycine-generating enzyme required for sulfatase activity